MGKNNEKPFSVNNQPMPQVKSPNVEIIIIFDPTAKKMQLRSNTNDWNQIEGILIDALIQAFKNRIAALKQKVVLASPQIHVPGS
jgi:hypothetical protein